MSQASSDDNLTVDIGEQAVVDKALDIASKRFRATDLRVVKSSLMSYEEAHAQLLEPIETDHLFLNTPVRVVEISGFFQRRERSPFQKEVLTPAPTFTKAYVVLRAADGLLLVVKAEQPQF
ncbi:MAG: hypothetical protein ACR2FS_01165 [Phormidesmis sp.]|jgi:hypothetical protein